MTAFAPVLDELQMATVAEAAGLALGAGVAVAVLAAAFRWYFRQRVPFGVALLVDAAVVTLYLNTRVALGDAVAGETDALAPLAVGFNLAVFGAAVVLVPAARRAGDRVGVQLLAATGTRELEGEVGQLVQAVGRAVAVELPEDIDDIEGYDPVAPAVKRDLAGRTLIFPRRLTVEQLRDRVVTRLKDDYEVGYVDVEVEKDGTATYLALGRRTAGIGHTLPPGTAAVAVRADPPNAAGAGDLVQVWETTGESPERVATAEIRGVHEDAVTLSLDEYDARGLAGGDYRLLTLPYEPGADRQFASLLRGADETMTVATVAADSDLDGATVGDVAGTVVAVRSADGVDAIPARDRVLAPEDTLYVVARPDAARRLDAAVAAPDAAESP
ncbi:potassium transporter TrkA [Halobacterium litoreum]|uniref:Potassium transporter TrkA n=1 Tax=Halobacterium litoreum TaxID=2039234 RepID=A0ABD5NDN5_9EURY|nr:potassium transporter TrkA [Halobacterium litoreum]UHH13814.1 potassium transporter TrkA [Halobacterium litoreum]